MASTVIRTTYALDADTVARLDRLAKAWKLSRSAALRKLIREREPERRRTPAERLAALRALQASSKRLGRARIEQWLREIREEREAGTEHLLRTWERAAR